ncbi:unnamed protein product, partial [Pleuronectes platessa]
MQMQGLSLSDVIYRHLGPPIIHCTTTSLHLIHNLLLSLILLGLILLSFSSSLYRSPASASSHLCSDVSVPKLEKCFREYAGWCANGARRGAGIPPQRAQRPALTAFTFQCVRRLLAVFKTVGPFIMLVSAPHRERLLMVVPGGGVAP